MSRLITISDGRIEAGVVPDLGGVVALFRILGKRNVFKADPALWEGPPVIRRKFGADTPWRAYNGHTVWLGPQSEWWTQQRVCAKMRRAKALWPPDPYINYGSCEVTERGAAEVTMVGPKSEFSGVQLTKSLSIKGGKAVFKARAVNIWDRPVSWDLWLNTRVDGYARCYAPVGSMKRVRVERPPSAPAASGADDASLFSHGGGYCAIDPQAPSRGKNRRWGKAFIPASKGAMAAFTAGCALVIRFKRHPAALIHPKQALVELYNITTLDKKEALTELEYHAPYVTLKPGESMEAEQTWELYPFESRPSHEECVDFLDGAL
jgi:hypothetical protein